MCILGLDKTLDIFHCLPAAISLLNTDFPPQMALSGNEIPYLLEEGLRYPASRPKSIIPPIREKPLPTLSCVIRIFIGFRELAAQNSDRDLCERFDVHIRLCLMFAREA